MADNLTAEQRSRCMSHIRSKDTGPEWTVRRLVYRLGYRYRLHRKDLPGTPDLVFGRLRSVILIHGCFWHVHTCQRGRVPKSNERYWTAKRLRNAARDRRAVRKLRRDGWRVLTVWECQLKDERRLSGRIRRFLEAAGKQKAPAGAGAGVDDSSVCASGI